MTHTGLCFRQGFAKRQREYPSVAAGGGRGGQGHYASAAVVLSSRAPRVVLERDAHWRSSGHELLKSPGSLHRNDGSRVPMMWRFAVDSATSSADLRRWAAGGTRIILFHAQQGAQFVVEVS